MADPDPNGTSAKKDSAVSIFDRYTSFAAAAVCLLVVIYLITQNQIVDASHRRALFLILAFSIAVLGASIPGYLGVSWSGLNLPIRATGGLAIFIVSLWFLDTEQTCPDLRGNWDRIDPATGEALKGAAAQRIVVSRSNCDLKATLDTKDFFHDISGAWSVATRTIRRTTNDHGGSGDRRNCEVTQFGSITLTEPDKMIAESTSNSGSCNMAPTAKDTGIFVRTR